MTIHSQSLLQTIDRMVVTLTLIIVYLITFSFLLNSSSVNSDELLFKKYGNIRKVKKNIFLISVPISILAVVCLIFFEIKNKNFQKGVDILFFYGIILYTQTSVSTITDTIAHRVDRNINRLGYILSIIATIMFISQVHNGFEVMSYIQLAVVEVLTLILMFVIRSLGAADFRILLIVNPISVGLFPDKLYLSIAANLIMAAVYQFIIQKKQGDRELSVPIGHIMLITSCLQFIIYCALLH